MQICGQLARENVPGNFSLHLFKRSAHFGGPCTNKKMINGEVEVVFGLFIGGWAY